MKLSWIFWWTQSNVLFYIIILLVEYSPHTRILKNKEETNKWFSRNGILMSNIWKLEIIRRLFFEIHRMKASPYFCVCRCWKFSSTICGKRCFSASIWRKRLLSKRCLDRQRPGQPKKFEDVESKALLSEDLRQSLHAQRNNGRKTINFTQKKATNYFQLPQIWILLVRHKYGNLCVTLWNASKISLTYIQRYIKCQEIPTDFCDWGRKKNETLDSIKQMLYMKFLYESMNTPIPFCTNVLCILLWNQISPKIS